MEIRDRGMRLEINPHLAVKELDVQKVYPSLPILGRALELGVKFCYGSDAHKSEEVGTMLDQLRLHPVYGQAIAQWEAE
jgi:histidinol phosphatase-like PHP family hydrolase